MNKERTRALLASVVLAVVGVVGHVAAASAGSAAQASPTSRLLLNHEHVDALSLGYEGGELSMQAAADLDSGNGQLFDPSEVLLQLKDIAAARAQVPADLPQYSFLGPPGHPLWIAPMTQDPDLVWPGWNTQRLDAGMFVDDVVHLHLRDVQGPGHVEVFMEDSGGQPLRIFSSTEPSLRSHTTPVGTHAHTNWTFDALGTYTLTFEATAATVAGVEVSTGLVVYRWLVGTLPTATELSAVPASAPVGTDVTLTARVSTEAVAEAGLPGSVTFLDGSVSLGEAPLVDGIATLTTADLSPGVHQLAARFAPDPVAPHVGDSVQGSESPTVPYTVTAGDPDPDPDPDPPGECAIEAVLDVGHVDVAARIVNGELVSQVKDTTRDGPPVWRDLETVAFHAKPEARTQVPAEGGFEFVGPPGSEVWMLPQVQDPNLLWPGWNTEEIDYSQLVGGVTWWLDAVEGPGDLAVFQAGDFGEPYVLLDSSDPLPQSLALPLRTHAHGNWAFDTAGIYRLAFRHTAQLSSGEELSSEGSLAVAVGDVNLDDLCPGGGVPDPPGDPGGPRDPGSPETPGDPGTSESAPAPSQQAAVPCPVPQSSPSSANGDAVVLDAGHVDYAARLVDGDLASQVKDGTKGRTEWRDPAQVVFHVKPEASTQVPAGAQFAFLGSPGATIWQIPQTQDPELLWLGWNTEEIPAGEVSGPVTWTLDAVDGPGHLAVYTLGSFGQPAVIFASGDGVGDSHQVPLGTHAHGNWAFTAEGTYRVTFTHRARLASGETVSDTATVTFAVGATDPTAIRPAARQTTSTTTTTSEASSRTGDCRLASTGSNVDGMLLAGGLLVGTGSAVTLAAHRRRRRA